MDLWRLLWQTIGGPAAPPAEGGQTYAEAVMALVPTAYWRLGEASGNLADSSGNSHTLTAVGLTYDAAGWTGDSDGACTWGGSGDYASVADHADWDIGTADCSISWVLKRSGTPVAEEAIIGHDNNGNAGEWGGFLSTSPNLIVVKPGAADFNLTHTATLYDDVLHHCTITFDRSGVATLYVDTVNAGSVDISAKVAVALDNATTLWVGARGATSWNLTGTLDELVFWQSRLLTSA